MIYEIYEGTVKALVKYQLAFYIVLILEQTGLFNLSMTTSPREGKLTSNLL